MIYFNPSYFAYLIKREFNMKFISFFNIFPEQTVFTHINQLKLEMEVTMGFGPMIAVLQTAALTNLATSPCYLDKTFLTVTISKIASSFKCLIELPLIIAILSFKSNSPSVYIISTAFWVHSSLSLGKLAV